MNAKKIMGAVLVALLAAALFVGAGAADDKGTYFVYQKEATGIEAGVWLNGAATVQVKDAGSSKVNIIPGENFVPGTYKYNGNSAYFTYPTASYAATGKLEDAMYIVANGGKVYNESGLAIDIAATAKNFATLTHFLVTYPDGTVVNESGNPWDDYTTDFIEQKGVFKIQAIFPASAFIDGTPNDLLLDKAFFSFTSVGADDATISAATSTVYGGEAVEVTVAGTPGYLYNLSVEGLTIAENQFVKVNKESGVKYNISMPNTGKATFTIVVNTSVEEATIKLEYNSEPVKKNGEITIKVAAPVVTAALEADSYYLGETIKVTGTSTSNADLTFAIKGTNLKEQAITLDGYKAGKTWEGELDTQELQDTLGKKLDVGTYTIIVKQSDDVVAALPVALKQPFISLTSAPEVVVQGTDAKFVGIAEAATEVYYYVFGTNYFIAKKVGATDFDENQFTFTIKDDVTKNMSAGQYFAVIQHPMYNKQFNIAPEWKDEKLTGAILLNTTADATKGTVLFNVTDRQTANAAQALCDALDSQNIDDMYVKYAFIVAGKDQSFVVNEIPTEVVKGDKFTVSGTSTANKGDYVTVEMISTAFAAVPKETVGSASFITLSTKVAEDGTWEVTFDTSDLNVDEYSVKVACKDTTWKTVTVNVVEGADEPVDPEQPEQPEQPTEPTTPGFGALAALAGLGAVAVLLLRRE